MTAVELKPAINHLEDIATESESFETSAVVRDSNGDEFRLTVTLSKYHIMGYPQAIDAAYPDLSAARSTPNEDRPFLMRAYRGPRPGPHAQYWASSGERAYTFGEALACLATGLPDLTLLVESITAKGRGGEVKGPELKQAAIAAWCEAVGITPPSAKELKAAKQNVKNAAAEKRKKIEDQLRSGEVGIKEWNSTTNQSKSDLDLKKLDLSGANLSNLNLSHLDFSGTNFSGTNLTGAKLRMMQAKNCNFDNAIFHDVEMDHINANGSSFTNADFKNVRGRAIYFHKANLNNAKFEKAELQHTQLSGADLTGATFKECNCKEMAFDANSVIPEDFAYWDDLSFSGSGIDPRKLKAFNESHAADGLDFQTFLDRLGKTVDKDRLKKSISMLKKESFELFSEVNDDSVLGIVKSQTDPDLVYSCRLTGEGHYSCCTQNLNVCGGLRGAICKHILVLLLGLAKANQLDPNKADLWARASAMHQGKLDKDIASQTFLRYKGAEAGEVDWRPTETTPEDFYAF